MKITWPTHKKVVVEMEDIEYQALAHILTTIKYMYGIDAEALVYLDRLHAEFFGGMDGRNEAKQRERERCG